MKNILFAILIIAGLSVLVIQANPVKAVTSACSINAQLSGSGSTSATVTAKDEVYGTVYTLAHTGGGFYTLNGVSCEYYTIKACATGYNGSATHINFNTIGYITMQSGQCESSGD